MNNLSILNTVVQTRIKELQEEAEQLQRSYNGVHDKFLCNADIRSLEFNIETTFDDGDTITYITKVKFNGREIFTQVEDDSMTWEDYLDDYGHTLLAGDLGYIGEALISIYHGENIEGLTLTKE